MAWKRFWSWLLRQEPPDDDLADEATYEFLAYGLAQQRFERNERGCWAALTPREKDVAALTYAGYSNTQIAYLLGVGLETVRSHIQRMLRKLDLHSKNEMCVALQREGAEVYIEQRLDELLNPPPPPGVKG